MGVQNWFKCPVRALLPSPFPSQTGTMVDVKFHLESKETKRKEGYWVDLMKAVAGASESLSSVQSAPQLTNPAHPKKSKTSCGGSSELLHMVFCSFSPF